MIRVHLFAAELHGTDAASQGHPEALQQTWLFVSYEIKAPEWRSGLLPVHHEAKVAVAWLHRLVSGFVRGDGREGKEGAMHGGCPRACPVSGGERCEPLSYAGMNQIRFEGFPRRGCGGAGLSSNELP
jgi:hypothetical protein